MIGTLKTVEREQFEVFHDFSQLGDMKGKSLVAVANDGKMDMWVCHSPEGVTQLRQMYAQEFPEMEFRAMEIRPLSACRVRAYMG